MLVYLYIYNLYDYRLPVRAFGLRTFGNSGGHFNLAILKLFASDFVILRFSRSVSLSGTILHPTVLNNSTALQINYAIVLAYLFGLSWRSCAKRVTSNVKSSRIRQRTKRKHRILSWHFSVQTDLTLLKSWREGRREAGRREVLLFGVLFGAC
jgi:hypothetical protein